MTLLDPQADRTLYTEALTTPPEYRFDCAVALTYSLSLDTLLSVPLHLLLHADGRPQKQILEDRLGLLDGLRRTTGQLSVFHQRGRILARGTRRVLYSLLEDSVFHAEAPGGGAFHPKVWLLRFRSTASHDGGAPPSERRGGRPRLLLRLVVLSRNLTADPSWDVSLTVEGQVGSRTVPGNESLVRLLRALPDWSSPKVPDARAAQVASLADDLARTPWDLPDGIDRVVVHATGLDRTVSGRAQPASQSARGRRGHSAWDAWLPTSPTRMTVVSPFCTKGALDLLAARSQSPATLVSHSEALDGIPDTTLRKFERCLVLSELLEPDDGEIAPSQSERRAASDGLHAKVYACDAADARTRLFVGSANATRSGLGGANVEVMAELVGRRKQLGSTATLLDAEGFGGLLEDFVRSEEPPVKPVGTQRIENAFKAVTKASLRLRCIPHGAATADGDADGTAGSKSPARADRWLLALRADDPVALQEGLRATVWPITLRRDRSMDARPLFAADADRRRPNGASGRHKEHAEPGRAELAGDVAVATLAARRNEHSEPGQAGRREVVFGPMAVSSLTRFIAFEIALTRDATRASDGRAADQDATPRAPPHAFVVRIPADGMPAEERAEAVVRQVVRNRKGFVRYLLFLLGTLDGPAVPGGRASGSDTGLGSGGGLESLPLLEEMTRAFCRDPGRLDSVRRLVEHLQKSSAEGGEEIVPKDFLDLWAAFEAALANGNGVPQLGSPNPTVRGLPDSGEMGKRGAAAASRMTRHRAKAGS